MSAVIRQPEIGQWYQRHDNDELFQITGIDEQARTVEIQSSDGTLDEIDRETWRVLPLELAGAPEDGFVAGEEVEAEDLVFVRAGQALYDPAQLARLP